MSTRPLWTANSIATASWPKRQTSRIHRLWAENKNLKNLNEKDRHPLVVFDHMTSWNATTCHMFSTWWRWLPMFCWSRQLFSRAIILIWFLFWGVHDKVYFLGGFFKSLLTAGMRARIVLIGVHITYGFGLVQCDWKELGFVSVL